MFKIAFPWAKAEEERTEREYLKAREFTSMEEVAGNVWISPLFGTSRFHFRGMELHLTIISSS